MPRGMKRTTIMSHGRVHDSKGVRGTYLRHTQPTPEVMDAIPDGVGTVGNIPETARPGQAGEVTRTTPNVQPRTEKVRFDAEGDMILPGGNRDGVLPGGPSTSRPNLDDVSAKIPSRSSSGAAVPEPREVDTEPAAEVIRPPVDPESDPVLPPTEDELSSPLPSSKRKLRRAKLENLREWCAHLEILPEEYVEAGEDVTGPLMRDLIAEKLGIDQQ